MLYLILVIVFAIIFDVIYHKIFHVVYIGSGGLIKEWTVCIFLAVMVVGMILK